MAGDKPVLLATARAGNVIGGGDWAEDRLIPDLVRAASSKAFTPIRSPAAVRPWQHVLEPLSGYLLLGQKMLSGAGRYAEAWNFGPEEGNQIPVGEIVVGLARHWPSVRMQVDDSSHPHETTELRLNSDKARHSLGWRPVWDVDRMLHSTADWYRSFYETGYLKSHDNLASFVFDARRTGIAWAMH
jgi:CDP-glucose 4,6-dehydratase